MQLLCRLLLAARRVLLSQNSANGERATHIVTSVRKEMKRLTPLYFYYFTLKWTTTMESDALFSGKMFANSWFTNIIYFNITIVVFRVRPCLHMNRVMTIVENSPKDSFILNLLGLIWLFCLQYLYKLYVHLCSLIY